MLTAMVDGTDCADFASRICLEEPAVFSKFLAYHCDGRARIEEGLHLQRRRIFQTNRLARLYNALRVPNDDVHQGAWIARAKRNPLQLDVRHLGDQIYRFSSPNLLYEEASPDTELLQPGTQRFRVGLKKASNRTVLDGNESSRM
jgi:hypothetical protein